MEIGLKDFILKSISEIHEGTPKGYELAEDIEFEVSVGYVADKKGKADLKILSIGASEKSEYVQKIKFCFSNTEQQIKSIDAEAKGIEKMISSLFNPLIKLSNEMEAAKNVSTPKNDPE